MEVELKALEANVEQAHKIEDDLANAKSAIAKKASDSDRLGEELKSIEQKLSKLGVKQEEIKQVQEQISTLNAQKDVMMAEKAKANKNMTTDYSDTDEELKAIYENFRQTHIQLLKQIEERTVKVKQLEADCLRSESHMSQLSEKIGRLAAQENDYRNNKKMLTELAAKFGETLSSEGGGYLAILERLQAAVKNKQAELSAAKQSALSLDQKNEELIANLKSEENKILEQIKLKTTQMEQAKAKRSVEDTAEYVISLFAIDRFVDSSFVRLISVSVSLVVIWCIKSLSWSLLLANCRLFKNSRSRINHNSTPSFVRMTRILNRRNHRLRRKCEQCNQTHKS